MVSKVNLKARIERHSRIFKENLSKIHPFRVLYHRLNYNIVLFLIIFLFPVYPLFSSFFYENSQFDFYRGDIDESSILESYIDEEESQENLYSSDSFLYLNTIMDDTRDTSGFNEIIEYEVLPGDSFSSIAYKFGVSNNSILWANNFDSKKILHPGEKIKIPPVSGLIHKVELGDTISSISKKYKVDEEKILKQNGLDKESILQKDMVLIIPGAVKENPKPINKSIDNNKLANNSKSKVNNYNKNTNKITKTNQGGYYSFIDGGNSEFVNEKGVYKLVKRTPQWNFYKGNCTRYVAQYKNVDWSGNAKDWLANAKAKGHPTGKTPSIGAIIVFHGKGYNPRYGHVGIVIDIKGDSVIVKDMNYRRFNEVTTRKVPKNDRAILGYIYVD